MRWRKLGRVYAPDGTRWWSRSNASFPTVDARGDRLRVYYATLDDQDIGRTAFVDVDAEDPTQIVAESPEPVLDVGEIGSFDDCGVNPFSLVDHDDGQLMYYQGWQRTERAPYLIFIGLAAADGDGWRKHSRTPVVDRTEDEPFLRGAPYVMKEGGAYRMWYVSCRRWVRDSHGLHYDVVIRHATSHDGITWSADPEPCLEPAGDEYGVGRPSVLHEDGVYRMWYSIRSFGSPYRIGYAESGDGLTWTRRDAEAGIGTSPQGWDSEMICYPQVLRVGDRLLMFYNGNRHGRTGFGCAELE